MQITFRPPGPVARSFMLSDAFVRGLRGPIGSAKSSTCIMELHRRQAQQRPNDKGWRMSRWVITRNTSPMLKTTTIKTYEDWLKPEFYGDIKMAPPPYEHEIDVALPDGTRLISEVYFLALDTAEDVRKLLSLELTGAFSNEAREQPKSIIDAITSRLRRYPAQKDGGFNWSGLIMDTNAPDSDHWWPIMAGEVPPPEGMSDDEIRNMIKPAGWEFFSQPAAMIEQFEKGKLMGYEVNPDAENLVNLDPLYYPGQIAGKSKAWIDVYLMNRLGATHDGRPVHSQFRRETHVSDKPIEPIPNVPINWGFDFGLTPAGIAYQRVRDRILVLREIVLTDAGAVQLAAAVNRMMRDEFPGHKFGRCWGDPAGDARVGTDKRTPFQIMRTAGIPARPVESNDPELRRAAGAAPLMRMTEGAPAILFDPRCKVLVSGLEGAWCYKRVRQANGEAYEDHPQKGRHSHPCEAWEYGMVGDGEARGAVGRKQAGEVRNVNVRAQSDPLTRFAQQRSQSSNKVSWRR